MKRRGAMLVVVLVTITLLTLSALAFAKFMLAQRRGTDQSLRQRQARLLAESGVEYLRILLMKEPLTVLELGGCYDNTTEFYGHIVTDGTISMTGTTAGISMGTQNEPDWRDVGRFSVVSAALSDDGTLLGDSIRYGLEDESCKMNLRWLLQTEMQQPGMGRSMLMRLPGVTEEIADSILDWLDEDSEPREYGAEDEYYAGLDPPYYTRNGLPDSLDELLLVCGMTPKLLYGIDWNRNGMLDLGEPDESSMEEFDVSDGSLNLGLISYLTLDSREPMVTSEGLEKINVNMDDLEELRTLLEERFENTEWVEYIISYRQRTPSSGGGTGTGGLGGDTGGETGTGGTGSSGGGLQSIISSATQSASSSGTQINSLLDLVQTSTNSDSPFLDDPEEMNEYLPLLYDNLTTSDEPISGRININQAPRSVLYLLVEQEDDLTASALLLGTQLDEQSQLEAAAGMGTETAFSSVVGTEIVEGILAERVCDPNLIDQNEMNYPFWPYTHGIVTDLETMKQLEPYFCTQGAVFKANVIGRFDEQSPTVRLEVWLDASTPNKPAKVIRIRELDGLGPGYSAEMLGADEYSKSQQ